MSDGAQVGSWPPCFGQDYCPRGRTLTYTHHNYPTHSHTHIYHTCILIRVHTHLLCTHICSHMHAHTHSQRAATLPAAVPPTLSDHKEQLRTRQETSPYQAERQCPAQSCKKPGNRPGCLHLDRLDFSVGSSPPSFSLNLPR